MEDREHFAWQMGRPLGPVRVLRLTSGSFRDHDWLHPITVTGPIQGDAAILYITGGTINQADLDEAERLSRRSGLPVAMLFEIPNQPLFGRIEDDLIAFTFDQFLETGDSTWPLLFPMVRAAVRAMDALEEAFQLKRFVLTGMSKRGWTTWLAGVSGDPRICGIAPMVFDNLNFPSQMAHQLASWGEYSEQIADYTSRDLQAQASSERGRELVMMMDPFFSLPSLRCPVLTVSGSNDRYWTSDALRLYWHDIPTSKHCLMVPNAGHILGDKVQMIETVGEFAGTCSRNECLPSVNCMIWIEGSGIHFDARPEATLWIAESDGKDFRDCEWMSVPSGHQVRHSHCAAFPEFRFDGSEGGYSLSLPTQIFSFK